MGIAFVSIRSELEVDELPASEVSGEHEGIEAGCVKDAPDVPRGSENDIKIFQRDTGRSGRAAGGGCGSETGRMYAEAGMAALYTIAPSIPLTWAIDEARKINQPTQTRWKVTKIRKAFQHARSTTSVGWTRSSSGRASRCATEDPLVETPEHERPGRPVPEPADDHRQHQVAIEFELATPASPSGI